MVQEPADNNCHGRMGFRFGLCKDKAPIERWREDLGERRESPWRVFITLIIPSAREDGKEGSIAPPGQCAAENDILE